LVTIETIGRVTDELVEAFQRLIPQLSSSSPPPTPTELEVILSQGACTLFIGRDPDQAGKIIGVLALVMFRTPTGSHAWIEDVVVDAAARGKGLGEALTRAAIDYAQQAGARHVDLTSNPSREAANRLYRRIGFKLRATNLYRYYFE